MGDSDTTVDEIRKAVRDFTNERDWEQFHNPKDVGVALSIEVAEVLEHFRFKTNKDIEEYLSKPENKKELSHEVADVFWFILRLSDVCGVDLTTALLEKLKLSAKKYPVEKVKGLPHKYTHYQK